MKRKNLNTASLNTPAWACPGFPGAGITRRTLLSAGGMGLLGLNLPGLLRAEDAASAGSLPVRAKSVIFLFQFGGPSHIDTFDMKPDAPAEIRGPHQSISSVVPGLPVSEHLPKMAKQMDRISLVRSMHPVSYTHLTLPTNRAV